MSTSDEQAKDRATRNRPWICGCPARSPKSWPALPGPKIGAFFDLDGTLVAGFTAVILTQERLRRRDMGVGELLSMVQAGLNHRSGVSSSKT